MKFKKLMSVFPTRFGRRRSGSILFDQNTVRLQLSQAVRSLEEAFGNLSQNLSNIDSCTQTIQQDCEMLLALSGGCNRWSELLGEAIQTLAEPMEFVDKSLQKRSELGTLMRECEEMTNVLLARQNEMVFKLEPLKFMLVFYKIEAAHLSAEHQSTFITVADEIMSLHQMVDETFRENIAQLSVAKSKISSALQRFIKEHEKHSKDVKTQRSKISDTINSLDQQLKDNNLQDTDLHHATKGFQQAIEGLITSLQTEDIFRQRCEAISEHLHDQPAGVSDRAWALLQARKIESAAREMRESAKDVQSGLNTILNQAKELDDASLDMHQFEHTTASADGMIQILLDSFDSMSGIFYKNEKLSTDSHDAVHPVRSLVEGLSAIVTEVSINIQLIALNAQVRSIQVGEGSGLEVLAARTADISSELRELGDETAIDIKRMQHSVTQLSELIQEDRNSSNVQSEKLNKSGGAITSQLHEMRNETLMSLGKIADAMKQVKGFIGSDYQKITQLPAIADHLESIATEIRKESNIDILDTVTLEKLEAEIAEELEATKCTAHTSLNTSKDSSVTFWEPDHNRNASNISVPSGEIELF